MRLQGIAPERPLTHDLFAAALNELGVRVERVLIASLADETFHARLVLATPTAATRWTPGRPTRSRWPSGSSARSSPSAEVLDQAAAMPDDDDDDEDEEARRARSARAASAALAAGSLEATGEVLDPTKLDIFREFINSLESDDPRSGGGSSSQG